MRTNSYSDNLTNDEQARTVFTGVPTASRSDVMMKSNAERRDQKQSK